MATGAAEGPQSTKAVPVFQAKTFASGRFVVQRLLGEGGQKTVYLARDTQLDRDVAIAAIKSHGLDEAGMARMRREAQTLAGLGAQPHIVTVFDIGMEEGDPFIVCEYMGGGDLAEALRKAGRGLPLKRAIEIAKDIARALEAAHARGILHRDIKPANVWLTEAGSAKLGDFGLAMASGHSRLTQAGTVLGTPAYMAPEQASGALVNAQADLYSLGCVIYEMSTGRPPFQGDDMVAVISQHINTPPAAPSWHRRDLTQPLERLILWLLAKAPADRPANAAEVLQALEAIVAAPHAHGPTQQANPLALLRTLPFVGRQVEFETLTKKLAQARNGQGAVVLVAGEPGIGKTRLTEEFAEYARNEGATVLWGRCYEGESARPYGPFAEAISEYMRDADAGALRQDMGYGAAPIARLLPSLREKLPDLGEPVSLEPGEERFRLFDAVAQLIIAASQRTPIVLVLDDLHWADKDTIAMLRHVARFAGQHRILLIGAYRDVELDRQHPLSGALGQLRRETEYERLLLKGLDPGAVSKLFASGGEQDAPPLVEAIAAETDGNPFFLREVLLHLVETGALHCKDGRWTSDVTNIAELGIPESVRQVIGRRLSRLSDDANRLLTVGSAFSHAFRFDIAAGVAGIDEMRGLDAADEALAAQLLQPSGEPDSYRFTHALIRHTLYGELSPSRQVRLHRQIAEAMEAAFGERALDRAADLAYQYHRSAALPGAERGLPYALAAADRAEAGYAHDDVVSFLTVALELALDGDPERPRLLSRLGLALAWTFRFDEALRTASEASEMVAISEGEEPAAAYLVQAARTMLSAGFMPGAWELAARGLRAVGERRDATWAWLMTLDLLRREAEDPDHPGIPLDTPERREVHRLAAQLPPAQRPWMVTCYDSRSDVLARGAEDDPVALVFLAGEYVRGRELWQQLAARHERQGQLANAVSDWAQVARCCNALGDFEAARQAYEHAVAFAGRLAGPSHQALQLVSVRLEMGFTVDPDTAQSLAQIEPVLQQPAVENSWAYAAVRGVAALGYAWLGRHDEALHWLETLRAPLERAPGWAPNYTLMACLAAQTLWVLERTESIDLIERNLLSKVVEPDFRFPMQDGRLSMARLCALGHRYEEAEGWFESARQVIDEQGARPLRALTDLTQAEMYLRRAQAGDTTPAQPYLNAAAGQFKELEMKGWLQRAERLGALAPAT